MITIKFVNNYNETKTIYFRYYNTCNCITDKSGANIPGNDIVYSMIIPAKQSHELYLKDTGDLKSAIAWLDTAKGRTWDRSPPAAKTDIGGPRCSAIEFTIDKVVSYDITAVEGLCGSYSITWKPTNEKSLDTNNVLCNPKPEGKFIGNFVPSDKNNSDLTPMERSIAGCGEDKFPVPDGKIKCRKFMNTHSYGPNGYCKWLYDNNCQGYCWAYDEMRCPDGKTCDYDKNGNPTLNGITQFKTVNGRPTNPEPKREPGLLTLCFGPLGEGGCTISNSPSPPTKYYKCVKTTTLTTEKLRKNLPKNRIIISLIIFLIILIILVFPILFIKNLYNKYLLLGLNSILIIIFLVILGYNIFYKTKYYKCDKGKCIEDTTGGTNYPNDPNCGNQCKLPPQSKYYKCDKGKCIEDTTGGTKYPNDPNCGNQCKLPSQSKYYKCDKGKCIEDTTGGTNYPNDPNCGNDCKLPPPSNYKCIEDTTGGKNYPNDPTCGGKCNNTPHPGQQQYKIINNWTGKDIKNSLDNQNGDWQYWLFSKKGGDPTQGNVYYNNWNQLITVNPDDNSIKISIGGISQIPNLRKAIRINTSETYNDGLFIMKAKNIPAGFGIWPSWWLTAEDNWACGGEIDIIEGVNSVKNPRTQNGIDTWENKSSLHISPPGTDPTNVCKQGSDILGQCGIVDTSLKPGMQCKGCNVGNPKGPCPFNGCGKIMQTDGKSFGSGFNQNGGGVYACLLENDTVTIWFFTNDKIPKDIDNNPNPKSWNANNIVSFQPCAKGQFSNLKMIINTTICGQWAGNVFPQDSVDSKYKDPKNIPWTTCNNFSKDPNQKYEDAYWEIDWIKVFKKVD